jgi:flagellar motor component MotA
MRFIWLLLTLFFILIFAFVTPNLSIENLLYMWNAPSFILVCIPAWLIAIYSTSFKTWKLSLLLLFQKEVSASKNEIVGALRYLKVCGLLGLWFGIFATVIGFILMCYFITDLSEIAPNTAVAMLTTLYGIFIFILCFAARNRIKYQYLSNGRNSE